MWSLPSHWRACVLWPKLDLLPILLIWHNISRIWPAFIQKLTTVRATTCPCIFPTSFVCLALFGLGGVSRSSASLAKSNDNSVTISLVSCPVRWCPNTLLLTSILGQMEFTLLHSFLRAGKLKRWLAKPDCPPVIKECKLLFDKVYAPRISDSNESSTGQVEDTTAIHAAHAAPADLRPLLKTTQEVGTNARVQHDGITYSSSKTHLGNSLVQFYPGGDRALSPIPGSIKYIYREGKTMYLAVQRQLPSDNLVVDPFAQYPHFPAKVYSSRLSQNLERVHLDWVFSHYARWNFTADSAVVLSLNRVRDPLVYDCKTLTFNTQE